MGQRWDIFCRVIDNFGDIGVCWRLARQLVSEHQLQVRLMVDDLGAFHRIEPGVRPDLDQQFCRGVRICRWGTQWAATDTADVVLEAFGCDLPETYIAAMSKRRKPCLWINLEYLSAEPWVEDYHGLPSPQAGGQDKYFFFPGFTEGTGGLVRETGLIDRRRSFQADAHARSTLLQRVGVNPVSGARLVSLFNYENPALAGWLDQLVAASTPTHLLVPEGRILGNLQRWASKPLVPGDMFAVGNLSVSVLPFMSQDDYDQLLWSCDLNIVRGEDSFVRAQWAGKPFIWQIYPQAEDIHMEKLRAFLDVYCRDLDPVAAGATRDLFLAWNATGPGTVDWTRFEAVLPVLGGHGEAWCDQLSGKINISQALVNFYWNWI